MLLLMALFAPLAMNAQTLLFTEDFEDGTMPTGWTTDGPGIWEVGTGDYTTSTGAGHGNHNALIMHSATGNVTKLITPEIDLSHVNSAELSFMHIERSWYGDIDQLRVYYRTSSSGTWTQLVEYTAEVASWTTEEGIVLPNLSATYQIAFEATDKYGYGVGIDYVNIVLPPSCLKPKNVAATNPTAHGATVSWTGTSDSYILMLGQQSILANYDFESNSIPAAFTNSTNYPWTVVANTHSGAYCAKSGNAGSDNTSSDLILEINLTNPGTISFSTMTSSESNYDWGRFLIDNVQQFQSSGTNNWETHSYDLAAGTHTLIWRFSKDGSSSNGDDCFYVDDIVIKSPSSWDETHTASASPYTFTDLEPETSYLVMVKGVCSDEQSQPSAAVSFTTLESCATPQNLAVATNNRTATATWTGVEGTCNIDINGTLTNNVTSPYTFNVELSTTYTVKVQANCDGDETSNWSNPVSITTPPCLGGHTIEYTLNDSYGDGWNGNAILLNDACDVIETLTIADGSSNSGSLTLCDSDYYQLTWQQGSFTNETSFTLIVDGTAIFTNQSGSSLTDGQVLITLGTATDMLAKPTSLTASTPDKREVELSWTENGSATAWQICVNDDETNLIAANSNPFTLTGLTPDTDYTIKVRATDGTNVSCWTDEITVHTDIACARPEDLAEANITYTTVDLSWTGTSDSYVAQYGTWTQVGTDHITTATLTPYTFDLSGFSGMGTIAIRHYNVTDMFRMNVDDIVVTDADGATVYSQNFESGSIPPTMSNIDMDGDGYVWGITSSNINGSYGVTSASWASGTALTPDNWLVIPDVQLGGAITFYAIGQDPSAVSENFGVFVIADNQFTEAYSGTNTSCQVTGLTEGTPYVWRVKGVCDEEPSNWVSSMFKTKDDLLVFAVDGAWDQISNWTDADGNTIGALPLASNKVRIDADATIASGVVATAKSVVLNGGSIEIEEGGQLKQGSTVKVTMHKGITGYVAGNEAAADHYYFIATPHSTSYLYENTTFAYVLNLDDGNYDLYAFDPTADLEWINYENNPDHSEFHTGDNYGLFNKKGYLYANESDKDLIFVGTVSSSLNNTLTDSYTYNSTSTDIWNGWKLVGNPFTCNAYISYVDANDEALEADFYVMNIDGDGYDLYSSNDGLAPLTGALVNYNATGNIQFASEAPAKANRTGILNMNVSRGDKTFGQARLRFGQGHNLGSMSFRNNSRLYMPVDGNDYAVVYTENQGEMPISFRAAENGNYTLSFNTEDVTFGYLHLIDNMTGKDVDLLSNPSYSFEAKTTDYANRFKLVFATGNADDNFAFFSNGSFVINNEGNATLQVVDVTGRIIKSESINGCANVNVNAAPGVYMIRLINGDNVKVQKVVVR